MYDVRQFKPVLYVLVILGMVGFALASESPGIGVFSLTATGISAWLVWSGRFRPVPRWIANLMVAGCVLFTYYELRTEPVPIITVGRFIVLMQCIKLYEQRANRDYAQLLVLNLLLMVAGAISNNSLLFRLVLLAYLFLGLYACLLFHLKVEADRAKATFTLPEDKINPATLRQDQRYLTRSMRRVAALVGTVGVSTGVCVFLLMPHPPASASFIPFNSRERITALSDKVTFQDLARITQNTEKIADVRVWKNDVPVDGSETLLFRTSTLDYYNGRDTSTAGAWQWLRSRPLPTRGGYRVWSSETHTLLTRQPAAPPPAVQWRQRITLRPIGTRSILALPGPISITPTRTMYIHYDIADQSLLCMEDRREPIEYEVVSANEVTGKESLPGRASHIDPLIAEYARRPEVTGGLAAGRPPTSQPSDLDEQIARNIEQHLKSNFTYTLDLTDAGSLNGRDPMVAFLYDLKRGHCEYFAGAMTLLCQSLNMKARMVIGLRLDPEDYNEIGGYYVARQSHAHAWVEVLTPTGWKTFDPTSSTSSSGRSRSLWQRHGHLIEYIDSTYSRTIIGYDQEDRDNLVKGVDDRKNSLIAWIHDKAWNLGTWFQKLTFRWKLSTFIAFAVAALVMATATVSIWKIVQKVRLRRRADRIGLRMLPPRDRRRLALQLLFYDELLRLLEKRKLIPPDHLTPAEFGNSLCFLPPEIYEGIRGLTRVFYRVRFGDATLSPARQRLLLGTVQQIQLALDQPGRVRA